MVGQEDEHSCGLACVRQLLLDQGVVCSEEELLALLEIGPEALATSKGLWEEDLKRLLNARNAHGDEYEGGALDILDNLEVLLRDRVPFIAMLERHWVIVDGRKKDRYSIRDPAEAGFCGEMTTADFHEAWDRSKNRVIFVQRRGASEK